VHEANRPHSPLQQSAGLKYAVPIRNSSQLANLCWLIEGEIKQPDFDFNVSPPRSTFWQRFIGIHVDQPKYMFPESLSDERTISPLSAVLIVS